MKNIYKYLLFFTMLSISILHAQPNLTLTIENQSTVGTDFFFDLYLSAPNDVIYLGNSDFVLTFNSTNFSSPSVSKEPSISFTGGNCTFVSVDATNTDCRKEYYSATSVSILNTNEIVINLNGPTYTDSPSFEHFVATIYNQTSTYRLGTFKVSGISNTSGTMDLTWKTGGSGVLTSASTQSPTTFNESPCNITATDPSPAPLPVELSSFNVNAVEGIKAQLQWETATEVNNYGFEIERSVVSESAVENASAPEASTFENKQWEKVAFVEGHGNSNSPKLYSFTDKNLIGGSKFVYRLKQIDIDGTFEYSDEVEIEVLPTRYELMQNYPNPFNPTTKIRFSLPEDAKIAINIYNVLGEKVSSILNEELKAGFHEVDFNSSSAGYSLATGVYIYTIETKNFSQVKKMILMK